MGLTKTATRLIAKYGQAAEILRPGEGHPDGTGNFVLDPATAYPCKALFAKLSVSEEIIAAGFKSVGDQHVLVSVDGLEITPETTDKLRIGGETLGIKSVVSHAPGGIFYFWEVQVSDLV